MEELTHACPQVQPEITQFYRELRDTFVSEQKQKSSKTVERLREEMSLSPLDYDSTGPSPRSSQPDSAGSTPKRHRPSPGPAQPTIHQSFVSQLCFLLYIFLAGSGIDEDDEIDASESDSDMEMHSADESTEMQELCYDICAEYLPECSLGGETDSESD